MKRIRLSLNQYLMSTAQIKEALKKHIDDADDRLLKMIIAMVEAYQEEDDPIVGYDVHGNPKRASEAKAQYEKSLKEVEKGNYITIEELKEKSKKWLKGTK